jgi:anti-sigma factor RsiW
MRGECVTAEELALLLDGELTENRAGLVRDHLQGCARCRGEFAALEALVKEVAAPIEPRPDAVERLLARLDDVPPAAPRRRWRTGIAGALAGLAAAAALAATLRTPRPSGQDPTTGTSQVTARGGPAERSLARDVGVTLYRSAGAGARDGRRFDALIAGSEVDAETSYAVASVNLGASGSAYVMVFAQDARGDLHWVEPAWLDPAADPEGVLVPHTEREVPPSGATVLDHPAAGTLRVFVMVTPRPLRVSEIERLARSPLDASALRARWPDAVVDETEVRVGREATP